LKKILLALSLFLLVLPFSSAFASFDVPMTTTDTAKVYEFEWVGTPGKDITNFRFKGTGKIILFEVIDGLGNKVFTDSDISLSNTYYTTSSFTSTMPHKIKIVLDKNSSLTAIEHKYVDSATNFNYTNLVFNLTKTSDYVPIILNPISDLTETHNYNSVNLKWTNPENSIGIIIKQDGVKIVELANTTSSYTVSGLASETSYNFEVIAKFESGNSDSVSKTIVTDSLPVDSAPPGEIQNLSSGVSSTGVTFMYDLPTDTDFSHLKIYRDGELLESNYKSNQYSNSGLNPNTSYVYKFVSVDLSGNSSTGYISTIKTEIEVDSVAPSAPKDINIYNGSLSGFVSWEASPEKDVAGYNVYVDGIKVNNSLIIATNYTLSNLENGSHYNVKVTAVDTSGNESLPSEIVTLSPTVDAMPIFDMDYDLSDVADGTANWFQEFWPILAFAVGIVLAFMVATRIKHLFLS